MKLPALPKPSGRSVRKIGLLGSHSNSLKWCPWEDPSWELWGAASSRQYYRRELDRYFDLHPKVCWTKNGKTTIDYVGWLRSNTVPIYMQKKHKDVPASRRYPKEQILLEYGGIRRYFTNQTAWMIALAFMEGVTHLGLFGINYGHETEYEIQRGSAEYWLGRAEERGVHVVLPDECTLLSEPAGLYGYESHDERGVRVSSYVERKPKPAETIRPRKPGEIPTLPVPPQWMEDEIAADEAMRPVWARPADKPNGGLKNA